jgi:hypothetical protein
MSRHLFGWDLPPGVSQRMIDEQCGEGDPMDIEVGAAVKDQWGGKFVVVAALPDKGIYVLMYAPDVEDPTYTLCGIDKYALVEVQEDEHGNVFMTGDGDAIYKW